MQRRNFNPVDFLVSRPVCKWMTAILLALVGSYYGQMVVESTFAAWWVGVLTLAVQCLYWRALEAD